MIIFNTTQPKFNSIIDLADKQELKDELQELIESYIVENTQRAVINNKVQNVFYISGLAKKHHLNLANQINKSIKLPTYYQATLVKGMLGHKFEHFWLKLGGNLIVDLCLYQFLKQLNPQHEIHYIICNNPLNKLFDLYHD